MKLSVNEELKLKLKQFKKPVIGIGVAPFPRISPALLFPNYSIITLQQTADIDAIKQKCKVFCLEEKVGFAESSQDLKEKLGIKKQNTSSILENKLSQKYLSSLGKEAFLCVYKSTPKAEKVCQRLGIKILSTPSKIRDPFEDKKQFRILAKKAGLNLIPGKTLKIDQFTSNQYELCKKEYGPKLVFQLPEYKVGGGIGTFFINSRQEWREFKDFIIRRRKEGRNLIWVNVTRFIQGTSASISSCITKQGTLSGLVQTQLVDIAEARAFKGRSGVWVGHDWGWKHFNQSIQKQGEKIAQTLGSFMAKKGYKGMFGIDLVIDQKTKTVWPVECNARYTGAFPVYSMMQDLYQEPNFDLFHFLEWLNIDYQIDFNKLQEQYRQPKTASHVIMHNQERKWVRVEAEVKAGIYKLIRNNLVWQRPGISLKDLKNKDEFCLVGRTPLKNRVLKPGERLVRVLFKDEIATSSNKLNHWASQVCKSIYKAYQFKTISSKTIKN